MNEILEYAVQPGTVTSLPDSMRWDLTDLRFTAFLFYVFLVVSISLYLALKLGPTHGNKTPLVYISICSLVGSLSIMAIKGFGVAIKLTLSGKNQLIYPSTYFFGIVVAVCIFIQMNYFNKALDLFSTNIVNPIYYVRSFSRDRAPTQADPQHRSFSPVPRPSLLSFSSRATVHQEGST